jgi:phosphocarrier protein FPr
VTPRRAWDEQRAEYTAIAAALAGRRVRFRTLDIGGDKPLPYVTVPPEANPFLGLRGVRLTLERPELVADQLQALCDVARLHAIDVMFPMVTTVAELRAARAALEQAYAGAPPPGLRVGMMVEVPAAALKTAAFVPHLDFVSIGTNDLAQYALAAERGNAGVAGLSDVLDPGVLRLVQAVCAGADGKVPVGVCGEAASDPLAVPLLVGLGVRELSVGPRAVAAGKALVRTLDAARCATLATEALELASAADVRRLVETWLAGPAE